MLNHPRSLRALVIEDDPNLRAVLRAVLAEIGWEVVEAANGQLGVAAFAEHQPDLVLIDIMMPVMDGLQVLELIHTDAERRRVPLLIMTALDDIDAMNRAFDLGALDFLNKPFNIRLLRRRLHALLQAVEVEHAIRRAKLEWEATFDIVPEAVFVTNDQGQVIRCNRSAIGLFQTGYAGLIGRTLPALFYGDPPAPATPENPFQRSGFETQFPTLAGWYQVSNHRVALEGQAAYCVHVVRDVTAQRQAEQALRESELHNRALIENLLEGIILLDGQGVIKFSSPAVDTILGYTAAELLDRPALSLIHPDQLVGEAARVTREARDPNSTAVFETEVRRRDGSYCWVAGTTRNCLEMDGVHAIVVTLQDITERRRTEQSLALQAQVLENMAEGVSVTDDTGVILFNNLAFEQMFGYERGELLGQPFAKVDVGGLESGIVGQIAAELQQRGVWNGETENVRKDGTPLLTANRVSLLRHGGKHYHVGLKTDITEQKQTQAWIMNTQKLADLGTLAAGVAHELNSPLQVITGVSESLLRRLDQNKLEPDYLRRNLDVVHRNGWRCAEIVRSLHTYARASGGQLAPASLNELLRDGLLLMEHQLASWSHITIQTNFAEDLPPLTCDRNQITQVLINLLTNARDAMPDGGSISLTTRFDPAAQALVLQVADTGQGIPEAIRSKIFDPFFTTKAIGKGTGLGLSIVSGIIRANGGAISLESQEGRGTTFTVQFPVAVPEAALAGAEPVGRFDEAPLAA